MVFFHPPSFRMGCFMLHHFRNIGSRDIAKKSLNYDILGEKLIFN